jgi:uncharacterized protein (TIGR03086 family)
VSPTTGEAEPIRLWRFAVETFNARLRLVEAEQWDLPTPCEGWTVRDLVDHVQWGQRHCCEILGYALEPTDDWPALVAAVETTLVSDSSLLTGKFTHWYLGEVPKLLELGIMVNDLVGHTWDLARAIGSTTLSRRSSSMPHTRAFCNCRTTPSGTRRCTAPHSMSLPAPAHRTATSRSLAESPSTRSSSYAYFDGLIGRWPDRWGLEDRW